MGKRPRIFERGNERNKSGWLALLFGSVVAFGLVSLWHARRKKEAEDRRRAGLFGEECIDLRDQGVAFDQVLTVVNKRSDIMGGDVDSAIEAFRAFFEGGREASAPPTWWKAILDRFQREDQVPESGLEVEGISVDSFSLDSAEAFANLPTELDRRLKKFERPLLVVHGGDGTLQAVIHALREAKLLEKVTVLISPGGTSNYVAKELGMPADIGGVLEMLNKGPVVRKLRLLDLQGQTTAGEVSITSVYFISMGRIEETVAKEMEEVRIRHRSTSDQRRFFSRSRREIRKILFTLRALKDNLAEEELPTVDVELVIERRFGTRSLLLSDKRKQTVIFRTKCRVLSVTNLGRFTDLRFAKLLRPLVYRGVIFIPGYPGLVFIPNESFKISIPDGELLSVSVRAMEGQTFKVNVDGEPPRGTGGSSLAFESFTARTLPEGVRVLVP